MGLGLGLFLAASEQKRADLKLLLLLDVLVMQTPFCGGFTQFVDAFAAECEVGEEKIGRVVVACNLRVGVEG